MSLRLPGSSLCLVIKLRAKLALYCQQLQQVSSPAAASRAATDDIADGCDNGLSHPTGEDTMSVPHPLPITQSRIHERGGPPAPQSSGRRPQSGILAMWPELR